MTNSNSGNVPQTIDSAGNIVRKPNGVSRWASPKRYECRHKDCPNAAVFLSAINAHNCCNDHDHLEPLDWIKT